MEIRNHKQLVGLLLHNSVAKIHTEWAHEGARDRTAPTYQVRKRNSRNSGRTHGQAKKTSGKGCGSLERTNCSSPLKPQGDTTTTTG